VDKPSNTFPSPQNREALGYRDQSHRPFGFSSNIHKVGDMDGGTSGGGKPNYHIPKMPFPKFGGTNPRIWIDKAVNYFIIYNIPRVLWITASTVAFDDNASKWLQVYVGTFYL
jgi:hypothetical protein